MPIRKQQSAAVNFVDLPELGETFADSLHTLVWDGQTLRIELCVTRYAEPPQEGPATANRYPVCRLVLTQPVVADLLNRLKQTAVATAQRSDLSEVSPPVSSNN